MTDPLEEVKRRAYACRAGGGSIAGLCRRSQFGHVRHLSSLDLGSLLLLACLWFAGCDRPATERTNDPGIATGRTPSTESSSAPDTMSLTIDAVPRGAIKALHQYAPDFVPFADSLYPRTLVAEARRVAFRGLMIVRADFQGIGRTDYVVAGMDVSVARVIALFSEPDGTYRAIPVTTFSAAELGAAAPRVLQLEREPLPSPRAPAELSINPLSGSGTRGNELWIWSPAQRRFVLEEFPN